jgi:phospholipid transport system transporter-binding protein
MNRVPFFSVESDTMGTLRVCGAISFANAASALARMPQPGTSGSAMDIDLSALEKSDSATLAVLIAWAARAKRQGVTLRFQRVPQGLRNLAQLSEVDKLLGMS